MDYSKTGKQLTERFEGLRLTAYRDQVGVLTIGYGHTGPDVVEGMTITEEEAQVYLGLDTTVAVSAVNRLVTATLTQSQFDALVDFTFNLGVGNFENSTLLKLVNEGNFDAAADEFEKWDHAGGKVVAGLLRRRQEEAQEFTASGETVETPPVVPPDVETPSEG